MKPRRALVTTKALEENAAADWNAFIQLLATSDYADLSPSQRPAYLVFWYESEVQNGGHLQYFCNHGDKHCEETVKALDALGTDAQARVLQQALARWRALERPKPISVNEYVELAREAEFDDLDGAFYDCPTSLVAILQRYFSDHHADFILRER